MTGHDPRVLDDLAVERLLTGQDGQVDPGLARVMAQVRRLADGPAPRPTAALAELLDGGFEPTVVPLRRRTARSRRWAVRSGTALAAAAASVLVAGSAAALPPALQNTVAELVGALTPFDLPRSAPGPGPRPVDLVPAEDVPPSQAPAPAPAPAAVPAPDAPSDTGPPTPVVGGGAPTTGQPGPGATGPTAVERQERAPGEPQQAPESSGTITEDTPNVPGGAAGSVERESPGTTRP